MSKFVISLIIINGLILPAALLVGLTVLIVQLIQNSSNGSSPDPVNIVNTITDEGDTLITQGLQYYNPESIYNSSNYYLQVAAKTYDKPLTIGSSDVSFERGYYSESSEHYLNVIYLDSSYNIIGTLLNNKASITSMIIPVGDSSERIDPTVNNIGYLIAFEDTNNDKLLDWNDNYDLYISNLSGKDLIQVTKGIDIIGFEFINNHREILIAYNDRTDVAEEYKLRRFAIYNIRNNQFKKLVEIDRALNGIQTILDE